ncbi:hypothetical protein AGMMS50229_06590 [Campylobacterota bacterium]|nr:hypothetical protein AGMMS50229_06590 [Campylobacterota bacterium]
MQTRDQIYDDLLNAPADSRALDDPLRAILASLIMGRICGEGVLPASLGLDAVELFELWNIYFVLPKPPVLPDQTVAVLHEWQYLTNLLIAYSADESISEKWLAKIVALGCVGNNHLWCDLGLANRNELTRLLTTAFPRFAHKNTTDTKWKKFIYHQYCITSDGNAKPNCKACND